MTDQPAPRIQPGAPVPGRRGEPDRLATVAVDAAIPPSASLFVDRHDAVRTRFAARWVADAITAVVRRRGAAVLALAGGSSVAGVHEALAREHLDWSAVTVTLADERAVPAGSPERNWRVVEALVDPLVAAGRLVPERLVTLGEVGPTATAAEVDAALDQVRARIERIDVALLGLGPDGHVASLFPGHPALPGTGSFVVVADAPKPPPLRVSATVGMLAGADAVAVVGFGDDKAAAVAAATTEGPLSACPGRIVHLPRRGVVVTDRLPRPDPGDAP